MIPQKLRNVKHAGSVEKLLQRFQGLVEESLLFNEAMNDTELSNTLLECLREKFATYELPLGREGKSKRTPGSLVIEDVIKALSMTAIELN